MAQLLITRRVEFEAAHRLETWVHSKCFRTHGHSWVLEATWKGRMDNGTSAVVDFSILGRVLEEVVWKKWDHQNLNEVEGRKDITSEYLAILAFRRICTFMNENSRVDWMGISLDAVRVQETANCWVTIRREDQPNE